MPEREGTPIPPWAEKERASDLIWIIENLHFFWPVARQGYGEYGRGAIVVDTTQRPTRQGHPFGDSPQEVVGETGDEDTRRMVREHEPGWEMVTVLPKTHDRTSTYRVGVLSRRRRR